jgi:hypothetical protein
MATNKRQAIESLIKAKEKLSGGHSSRCPADLDPDGSCTCGASANYEVKLLIDKALDNLLGD